MFAGFSVWLELEQFDEDLDKAIRTASTELGVHPIPEPHVTVLYGICSTVSEWEMRRMFREIVEQNISMATSQTNRILDRPFVRWGQWRNNGRSLG